MPKTPKHQPVSAAKPSVPNDAAKAFAEVEPLLDAILPGDILHINVDIPRAA